MQNKKTVVIISELFQPPYDEGMKVTALSLLKAISRKVECIGIGAVSDSSRHNIIGVPLNKLMFSFELQKVLRRINPKLLVYIPEASATLNSFIRYRILQWMSNADKTAMVALQKRSYDTTAENIIRLLSPEGVYVLSLDMVNQFEQIGIQTSVLPVGVDMEKFTPASNKRKITLRNKYNIPQDCYLLLHVGHIRGNRNIRFFLDIVQQLECRILIVGSTSTPQEDLLKEELQQSGIFIIDFFVPEINELYQLADCYVFPVNKKTGAMEFPLSVLEAMACNLPVLTTPFGSLPEYFSSTDDFRYFTTTDELIKEINHVRNVTPQMRGRAEEFSWERIAEKLIEKYGVLQ